MLWKANGQGGEAEPGVEGLIAHGEEFGFLSRHIDNHC